jgi:parallel beta-helix repeat protein
MKTKIAVIVISLTMILASVIILVKIAPEVKASTIWFVDDEAGGTPSEDFTSIQDAINASSNGDTVFVYNGTYFENVVVNKTINLIGEDKDSTIIDAQGNGDVVYVNASWVNITGFLVKGSGTGFGDYAGIELNNVQHCKITNNIVTSNTYGINLNFANLNNITLNNASSNDVKGIRLRSSDGNNISGNIASNSQDGICIITSEGNNVADNDVIYNIYGIYVSSSGVNNIVGNNASLSRAKGIFIINSSGISIIDNYIHAKDIISGAVILEDSRDIYIYGNSIIEDGIIIIGDFLENWNTLDIDTSNTVNGKTVYYWKNRTGGTIPPNAGQVILANCTNINIENQKLTSGSIGIQIGFSTNNTIVNNNISSHKCGIYLFYSNKTDIIGNNASSNIGHGIYLRYSNENCVKDNIVLNNFYGIPVAYSYDNNITNNNVSNNLYGIPLFISSGTKVSGNTVSINDWGIYIYYFTPGNLIYHNNIINNTNQAHDESYNENQWDNGYPIGGNYWSDYTGIDNYKGPNQAIPGCDGIGDTPYSVDSYPLMEPYTYKPLENYTILNQGWNLISIPLIQYNKNITKVLEMIDGYYDAVQWYNSTDKSDPWKHNKIGKSFGNDLFGLNETMGLWIHITQPGDTIFIYNGTQPTINQTKNLIPGWNLVGYPSLSNKNRTDALNNIDFISDVDAIWTYNATTQKWKEITESDNFEVGRGYWMHSKVTKTWIVPL